MATVVLDIETVGEHFDELDETTQGVLTRWIQKESQSEEEYKVALEELKDGLGFSPLTGAIVALGVLDVEKDKGVVYYEARGQANEEVAEGNMTLKQKSERGMLEAFWHAAEEYDTFVTFNGRTFDVPFMLIRSAVHELRPSKNLMAGRYPNQQRYGARHVDLLDELTFYGAVRRKGNLHLWTRAFGIDSPKAGGVSGDNVAELFHAGKCQDIARYNIGDLIATKELYLRWREYLQL